MLRLFERLLLVGLIPDEHNEKYFLAVSERSADPTADVSALCFGEAFRESMKNPSCACGSCRKCLRRVSRKIWLIKNKESVRRQQQVDGRRYRMRHREALLAKARAHWHANKDRMLAEAKEWRARNHEKVLKIYSNHYYLNREAKIAYVRKWQSDHPERAREISKRAAKAYATRNPDVARAIRARRRARKAGSTVDNTGIEAWMASVRSKRKVRCFWCSEPVNGSAVHFDHVIPISKGGPHAVSNLCVSCEPCNLSKNAKLPSQWGKHPQIALNL